MVTGTPWHPRPGEVVTSQRYTTRALIERCTALPRIAGLASERANTTQSDVERGSGSCVQVTTGLSRRAPRRGSRLKQTQGRRVLCQRRRQLTQNSRVEAEDVEPATSSPAAAEAAPGGPCAAEDDESTEQEESESKRHGTVVGPTVCALLPTVLQVLVDFGCHARLSARHQPRITGRP